MARNSINLSIFPGAESPQSEPGGAGKRGKRALKKGDELIMSKLVERWLTFCEAQGASEQGLHDYRVFISKFEWWYNLNVKLPVAEMTEEHAMAFVAYLRSKQTKTRWGEPIKKGKEKLSAASVATYARTARTFFNWLEDRKFVERSPFTRSVKITSKKEPIIGRHHKNIQEEQIKQIFEYLTTPERLNSYTGHRNLAIIALLLDSGMRRGELLSMRIGDIDWPRRRITIRGKTGERVCFFTPKAEFALLQFHDKYRKRQKELLAPTSPYWLNTYGTELMPSGVSAFILKMQNDLGFPISAHRFRHTFASIMVTQAGVYEVKELLGHSNINTTMVYTHGSPDQLQESHRGKSPLSILDVGHLDAKPRRGRPTKLR